MYMWVICSQDHPRVCGEKKLVGSLVGLLLGSPPRMRGKALFPRPLALLPGITPAYAGKSVGISAASICPRDHPRVCGEKIASCTVDSVSMGSPPRMRGKEFFTMTERQEHRITPAYAGKSALHHLFQGLQWDHPRVCGEKTLPRHRAHFAMGSPPRMRGKGSKELESNGNMGITPAYAGKSLTILILYTDRWDHPRVCGEKDLRPDTQALVPGSPPRMRGKGHFRVGVACLTGITPAYAGKSAARVAGAGAHWDHPRVCGEKSGLFFLLFAGKGSPPRMRGKVYFPPLARSLIRITPAYAGKSCFYEHFLRQL